MTKSYKRHLEHAKQKNSLWTKAEINAVRKCIKRINDYSLTYELVDALNEGGFSITKEQTKQGLEYLTKGLFNKKGQVRRSEFSKCFNDLDVEVIRSFSHFTFEGLEILGTHWLNTYPIYRVHSTNGSFFDYTSGHWCLPEVVYRNKSHLKAVNV